MTARKRKRLAIYAHYDRRNEVKRYVIHALAGLREVCERVVFVSNSPLPPAERAKVEALCEACHLRDNAGFDFAMWQHGLAHTDLGEVDQLVLANSSVFGPLFPLASTFAEMDTRGLDAWGLSDNEELAWHLQSYFLVFEPRVFRSEAFQSFWRAVLPYRTKLQVVRSYEVGLSVFLGEAGFRLGAFVPAALLPPVGLFDWLWRRRGLNPMSARATELVRRGLPFVKVETLRDNCSGIALAELRREMARAGYDASLIELT